MSRARHRPTSTGLVDTIYTAARDRDIPISRRRVEDLIKREDREEVEEWVKGWRGEEEQEGEGEGVGKGERLSREERELWNHISHTPSLARQFITNNSTHSTRLNSSDIDSVAPLTDSDFRDAIKSLEASTAAIEAQAKVLEGQQRALDGLVRKEKEVEREGKRVEAGLARKRGLEVQDLEFRISDLHDDISATLKAHQDAIPTRFRAAQDLVTKTLREDDRILEHLNSLTAEVNADNKADRGDGGPHPEDSKVTAELKHIDKLCTLLTALLREEITTRLDITYLQHSAPSQPPPPASDITQTHPPKPPAPSPSPETEHAILLDLNSLHAEIPVVADLYVNTLFRQPLSQALQARDHENLIKTNERREEITRTMGEIARRLKDTRRRIEGLGGLRAALEGVGEELEGAAASVSKAAHQTPSNPSVNPSLARLLSFLGLPVPASNTSTSTPSALLSQHLHKRLHRSLQSQSPSSSPTPLSSGLSSAYAPLKAHLSSFAHAARVLRSETLPGTSSGRTHANAATEGRAEEGAEQAQPQALEKRMADVGSGIEELGGVVQDLELEMDGEGNAGGGGGGDGGRDGGTMGRERAARRFVARWGGGGGGGL